MAKKELEVLIDYLRGAHAQYHEISGNFSVLAEQTGDAAEALERLLNDQNPDPDPEPDPDPDPKPTDFKTFHIIDHRNQPDLRRFGLEPLKIYYEGAFFDQKDNRDENNRVSFQDINLGKVRAAARAAPNLSVPDVERWAHKDHWRVPQENIDRYIEMLKEYRSAGQGKTHGLYSILPIRDYFRAAGTKGPAKFKEWQSWNDEVAQIVPFVDMLFPSLYVFSSVFQGQAKRKEMWRDYAVANIEEARRIAPGKPVYPFLWPWYHPKAKTPIEPDFWTFKLDVMREHADGFVIWDDENSTKTDWGTLPPWWDATVEWLEQNR